ncbi:MAG: hypothetical protein BWZ10_03208 [candidate division BRC1 bacterium ADurb.BinA364]|nr:MAG: hypothetical protein BWZ10_03208 [candidate division BRC1 bacterium ADurb.BinA364]
MRVPGLLEWPARIPAGGATSVACSTLDFFPTTLDILGFRMEGQPEPIDGISLVPLIEGRMAERPVPIPFETLGARGSKASRTSPRMALIGNRYKLLTDMEGMDGEDLLFDLLADPGETQDIAASHPDIVEAMKRELAAFRESCKRSLAGEDYATPFTPDQNDIHPSERKESDESESEDSAAGNRPGALVLQNDDSGLVSLSAAAAATHGAVVYRSDQDKIGLWKSEKDWLSWTFRIHQPGEFEVEASIGQTQDGSVFEIAADGQRLQAAVVASGDYTLPKTQTIGRLRFASAGEHTLELRPISKKGAVVMTLWRIDLIPVKE